MTGLRMLLLGLVAAGLGGCWWDEPAGTFQGYVEGDFLDVGAEETARLVALEVRRGDQVEAGAVLFRLDDADAAAERREAIARLDQARAQLADLRTGKRPEELAVLEAQAEEIAASLDLAERDLKRYETLHEASVVSDARAETARERFAVLSARLKAIEAQLEVAKLPARPDAIAAAGQNVAAAEAVLARIDARLARLNGIAPMSGSIQDIFFEPGEVVPAGRAVVSLLPPENLKVRFFVPETDLSRVVLGGRVDIACDSCVEAIPARVSFVAREAEFTPPVIYSVEARAKLVYMVEATPDDVGPLKVGQPVDVRLAP
ncbi:HlyD family secretion protein [Tepidamorphus gemmatus]|uniref:HlyD family secretion protein n=1 Tax=Tepidamorphus gemmatus TaxID=747076 RepID=A0A4R3MFV6_9HYPH|nr:HlyD family efflux transporter periplasmic adaptor subunit [Tepidamorphus gemmatus]TCT12042.1 HlyD family secretion protein [Tepidamorphus gemmatus]